MSLPLMRLPLTLRSALMIEGTALLGAGRVSPPLPV
jgi:hypothetical protein